MKVLQSIFNLITRWTPNAVSSLSNLKICAIVSLLFAMVSVPVCLLWRYKAPSSPPSWNSPSLLRKINGCSLGLRHVTGIEIAAKESIYGFVQGCSLNINPYLSSVLTTDFDCLMRRGSNITVTCFELDKKIKYFISNSLTLDLVDRFGYIVLGKTKVKDFVQIIEIAQFCLVDNSSSQPCDFNVNWGAGLGRYPKESVAPGKIHYLPTIKLNNLGYSQTELESVIMDEKTLLLINGKMVDKIYQHFLSHLEKTLHSAI